MQFTTCSIGLGGKYIFEISAAGSACGIVFTAATQLASQEVENG